MMNLMKNESPLEAWEQKEVVSWYRAWYPDHKIIMLRNDGSRSKAEKVEQIRLGLCKGAADLYIPCIHAWVEMKRIKGSVWGKEQREFKAYVESIGDTYLLCYGHEEAIKLISEEMKWLRK